MKKILSLVLAVVMIMAMAVPAFAASEDEIAPCALCNGSHTYEEALEQVSYSCDLNGCAKTTVTHYKCVYCTSTYATTETDIVAHNYKKIGTTSSGGTIYKCSQCNDVKTVS